jgi:hypothetical protein
VPDDEDDAPPGGRVVSLDELDRWHPWTPWALADRLAGVDVPWGVAGGWAVDLFLGACGPDDATRPHEDLELVVPAAAWPRLRAALPDLTFEVLGSGRAWPADDEAALAALHQTWGQDADGAYVLDVFREPHDGDTWICRRDATLRRPYTEVLARTADGVPYVVPEIVLLFKAKAARPKDAADLGSVLPHLASPARAWLADALDRAHPGHPWGERLVP